VCFKANGLRFLWGRGLCYREIGGAEKKISRGDMVGAVRRGGTIGTLWRLWNEMIENKYVCPSVYITIGMVIGDDGYRYVG
jgi:hypothetical protein